MLKINILNLAHKMPQWVNAACDEYIKRINSAKYKCSFIELKPLKGLKRNAAEQLALEGERIYAAIPRDSLIIVLDEHGTAYTSRGFAQLLAQSAQSYSQISIIIGSADGVDPELKNKAHAIMSLSNLVFPHGLVRVLMVEQIYRAISLLENHPYHRD